MSESEVQGSQASQNPPLEEIVNGLQAQLAYQQEQIATASSRYRQERLRWRVQAGFALMAVTAALFLSPASRQAIAQQTGGLPALEQRVAALEAKVAALTATVNNIHSSPFTVSGTDVTLTGYNLHIVSGSGATNDGGALTGLGNLIIGYNAPGNPLGNGDVRTGSHNLILGDANNYASYGGFVAGAQNQITAPYASVCGGYNNTVSGFISSVFGGDGNIASGYNSTTFGGELNTASGEVSTTFGGVGNLASAEWAAVFGGQGNTSSGLVSSASGGFGVTEANNWGWAAGGSGAGAFHNP